MKALHRPTRLNYPDITIAPVVETIYVDGYKFEICEFIKEAFADFGIKPKCRFFLFIEDRLHNENVFNKHISVFGGEKIWGALICADKDFHKKTIKSFESKIEHLKKLRAKNANGANFYTKDLEESIFNQFSIQL